MIYKKLPKKISRDSGAKEKKMDIQVKQLSSNWYSRFKLAHYSEPEQKGEGYGGTGQFGERRLGDWKNEHKEQVARMSKHIDNWSQTGDKSGFEAYQKELMNYYNAPENKAIVNGIMSAAMKGKRF